MSSSLPSLDGRRILILATDGFEQSELISPRDDLRDAGAEVHIAAPESGSIKGWADGDWGDSVDVDHALSDVNASDYDALVLPGGVINPDKLRRDQDAISLIRQFSDSGKPVAAICHAPWLLVEAGLLEGRRATSFEAIVTDVKNAGAAFEDSEVVVDGNLITSRKPDDLPAFNRAIAEAVAGS